MSGRSTGNVDGMSSDRKYLVRSPAQPKVFVLEPLLHCLHRQDTVKCWLSMDCTLGIDM